MSGADLGGVLYLRRLDDSDRIKESFASVSRIAVIGAGSIGLETADAARAAGVEGTVLETGELPLLRMLGREAAQILANLHSEYGVDPRCGVQVAEITGDGGWANGVLLADGDRIEADAVIVGIGIPQHRASRSGRSGDQRTGYQPNPRQCLGRHRPDPYPGDLRPSTRRTPTVMCPWPTCPASPTGPVDTGGCFRQRSWLNVSGRTLSGSFARGRALVVTLGDQRFR